MIHQILCSDANDQYCYIFVTTYCTFFCFMQLKLTLHPSAAKLLTHDGINKNF